MCMQTRGGDLRLRAAAEEKKGPPFQGIGWYVVFLNFPHVPFQT